MMCIILRILCLAVFFMSAASVAGIQPGSTRVIYPAGKREVTLQMINNATTPRLIQAWIDRGDRDTRSDTAPSPFFVTPPISRIEPNKGQTLRIAFIGGNVPSDRESVFWLNILELQPKSAGQKAEKSNVVQFSIRTRLKVFYRPEGLPGKPGDAVNHLRWRAEREGKDTWLACENSGVFNVSFQDIQIEGNTPSPGNPIHGMCPAKGHARFQVSDVTTAHNGKITLISINDYGGFENKEYEYKTSQ